jgi:hypothetical protein
LLRGKFNRAHSQEIAKYFLSTYVASDEKLFHQNGLIFEILNQRGEFHLLLQELVSRHQRKHIKIDILDYLNHPRFVKGFERIWADSYGEPNTTLIEFLDLLRNLPSSELRGFGARLAKTIESTETPTYIRASNSGSQKKDPTHAHFSRKTQGSKEIMFLDTLIDLEIKNTLHYLSVALVSDKGVEMFSIMKQIDSIWESIKRWQGDHSDYERKYKHTGYLHFLRRRRPIAWDQLPWKNSSYLADMQARYKLRDSMEQEYIQREKWNKYIVAPFHSVLRVTATMCQQVFR